MKKPILLLWCLLGLTSIDAAETRLDESNSWPLRVPRDRFTADAELDLRYLNEKRSGQDGFIRLSADRNDFVRGDGEPIRFWAVGTDAWKFSPEDMGRHCRWLAKLGVNLARLHVTVCNAREGASIRDVKADVIAGAHRFIKAAKENGPSVLISPTIHTSPCQRAGTSPAAGRTPKACSSSTKRCSSPIGIGRENSTRG